MSIAWRDSASGVGSLTIPSDVKSGDLVLIYAAADSSVSLSSTGTTPVQVGATLNGGSGTVYQLYSLTAGSSDAGATVTATSASTVYLALGAWLGAALDTSAVASIAPGSPEESVASPTVTTTADDDWGVYIGALPVNGSVQLNVPGPSFTRINTAQIAIADTSASVGPSGSVFGGPDWTSNGTVDWGVFTVGLKPTVGGPPIAVVQAASSGDISNSCTMPAGLTEGNWLVIIAGNYDFDNTAPIPTDPTVGGESIAATMLLSGNTTGGDSVSYVIWLAQIDGAMAGQTALSFTPDSGSGGPDKIYGIEIASPTVLMLDRSAQSVNTSDTTSVGPTNGTTAANEIAIGVVQIFNEYPAAAPSNWTEVGNSDYTVCAFQILTSVGSTPGFSGTATGSNNWCSGIITLRTNVSGTGVLLASFF